MMRWTAPLWAVLMMTTIVAGAAAQDIDDLDEGVVLETPFEPGVEANAWELALQVGYIDLSQTLVEIDDVIIDLEDPQQAIFSDVALTGESSFHPQLRVTRTFGNNFAFENTIGFAVGDFTQEVTGAQEKWTDPQGTNEFTEIEREQGSFFMWMHEHSLAWYPRGEGRVQPYLVGGVGTQHFSIDSVYTDGTTSELGFSVGGGLRVVGDDLYSLRLEVRQYFTKAQYTPNTVFERRPNLTADGLIDFPVAQLVDRDLLTDQEVARILSQLDLDPAEFSADRIPVQVEELESQDYSNLWFSLGFVASF